MEILWRLHLRPPRQSEREFGGRIMRWTQTFYSRLVFTFCRDDHAGVNRRTAIKTPSLQDQKPTEGWWFRCIKRRLIWLFPDVCRARSSGRSPALVDGAALLAPLLSSVFKRTARACLSVYPSDHGGSPAVPPAQPDEMLRLRETGIDQATTR